MNESAPGGRRTAPVLLAMLFAFARPAMPLMPAPLLRFDPRLEPGGEAPPLFFRFDLPLVGESSSASFLEPLPPISS